MKTLQMLLGIVAIVALLGLNVAVAEIQNSSAKSPNFSMDAGDGSTMPDISFDTMGGTGGDEAQSTCAMTPGGTSPSLLLEEPVLPPETPVSTDPNRDTASSSTLAPLNSLQSAPPYRGTGYPTYPPGVTDPTPDPDNPNTPPAMVVPEPTTMAVVALGLGGVALVSRRRGKKN